MAIKASKVNEQNYFNIFIRKVDYNKNIESLFTKLKLISNKLSEDSLKANIKSLIRKFNYSLSIYNKFKLLLNKIDNSYSDNNLKKIIWCIYAYCRQKLLKNSFKLIDSLLLLIAVILKFSFLFNTDNENKQIEQLKSNNNNACKYEILKVLLLKSLSFLDSSSNNDTIYKYSLIIENIFNNLKLTEIDNLKENIKKQNNCILENNNFTNDKDYVFKTIKNKNLLHNKHIILYHKIYNIFSKEYNSQLGYNDFDELLLLLDSQDDCSPVKNNINFPIDDISNFDNNKEHCNNLLVAKQLEFSKLKNKNENTDNFAKPSILFNNQTKDNLKYNNDYSSNNFSFCSFNLNNNNANLLSNNNASPIGGSSNFQSFTPITRIVNLNKWISQYISNYKPIILQEFLKDINYTKFELFENSELKELIKIEKKDSEITDQHIIKFKDLESLFSIYINKLLIMMKEYKISLSTNTFQIINLCLKITEGLIKKSKIALKNNNELILSSIYNIEYIKSLCVIAYELVLYIENIQEVYFYKLCNYIDLDCYSLLKLLNSTMTFDLMNIPNTLRYHLAEIEVQLIQFMIFSKKFSLVGINKIKNYLINYEKEKDSSNNSCFNSNKKSNNEVNVKKSPNKEEKITFETENNNDFSKYELTNSSSTDTDIQIILKELPYDFDEIQLIEDKEFSNQSLFMFCKFKRYIYSAIKENSDISKNLIFLNNYLNITQETIVLRKILVYMLLLTKFICSKIKLKSKTYILIEKLVKELVLNSCNIDLMENKHLDHIVLSCIITVLYNEKVISNDEVINKVIQS